MNNTGTSDDTRMRPPRSATGSGGHYLADYQAQISDTDWLDSLAVREAAHAVAGMITGHTVEEMWVSTDQNHTVGKCLFTGFVDVHLSCVPLLAASIADAKRIGELGYCELVQAAVETLRGQADHATVYERIRDGWVIWWTQAQRDAQALVDDPAVWEAITTVGEALHRRGRLTDTDIRALIEDPRELTDHPVWQPRIR